MPTPLGQVSGNADKLYPSVGSFWLPVCWELWRDSSLWPQSPPQPRTPAYGPTVTHLLHPPRLLQTGSHSLLHSILPRSSVGSPQVSVTLPTSSTMSHLVCGETQSNEQVSKEPMRQPYRTPCDPEKSVGFIKSLCIHSTEEAKASACPWGLAFPWKVTKLKPGLVCFLSCRCAGQCRNSSVWVRDLLVKPYGEGNWVEGWLE